jgi:hypothetical protein
LDGLRLALHLSDLLLGPAALRPASPRKERHGHRGDQQDYQPLHLISFAREGIVWRTLSDKPPRRSSKNATASFS